MKIKIGDIIHDANIEPIMIIFDSKNEINKTIENIGNMGDATKYCIYPDNIDVEIIKEFMKTNQL